MMLGEMQLKGRMYSHSQPTLVSDGKDIKEALAEAVKHLPQKIYEPLNRSLDVTAGNNPFPRPATSNPMPTRFTMMKSPFVKATS
jgi:N12 class adenine-specific DNA methylase